MTVDLSVYLRQATDQVSCVLDDEVVILHLESSLYFGVDRVGACIWEALNEPTRVGDICRIVSSRFDVGEEECRPDVLAFLDKLASAGLIQAA